MQISPFICNNQVYPFKKNNFLLISLLDFNFLIDRKQVTFIRKSVSL